MNTVPQQRKKSGNSDKSAAYAAAANPGWTVYAWLVVSMALWGGTWPVGRVVAAAVNPWNAAFLRFIMATTALVVICLQVKGRGALRVRRGLLPQLLMLGATGIFGYSFLFFSGLKTTPAGRAGLIVGCIPVSIAFFSSLFSRKRLPLFGLAGILLSLIGVSVVISNGNPLVLLRGKVRTGDLMILGCVFCWTAYTLLARPVMKELSPLVALTWSCIIGTLLILPFALLGGLWRDITGASWAEWGGLAYLGVVATSLAYYWYYNAICHVGPVGAGIFINLVPLFAVLLGCIFLKEPLYISQILGGIMVVSGVVITVRANNSQKPPSRPTRVDS